MYRCPFVKIPDLPEPPKKPNTPFPYDHLRALGEGHSIKPFIPKQRAATILCLNGNKVLAVARKDDPNAWGIVGGKVDAGETFEQAAKREFWEETGLEITDLYPVFQREDGEFIVQTFMGRLFGPNLCISPGLGEGRIGWIPWSQLFAGPFGKYNLQLFRTVFYDDN